MTTTSPEPQQSSSTNTNTRKTRGRSGCLNCRARRKKCDEVKPVCSRCSSFNDTCKWDEQYAFRSVGLSAQHPSMQQSTRRKSPPELQIIDMSFKPPTKRRRTTNTQEQRDPPVTEPEPPIPLEQASSPIQDVRSDQSNTNDMSNDLQDSAVLVPLDIIQFDKSPQQATSVDQFSSMTTDNTPMRNRIMSDATSTSTPRGLMPAPLTCTSTSDMNDPFDQLDLGTLDYLTSHTSNIDMLASAVQMGDINTWSPEKDFTVPQVTDSISSSSPDLYSVYYPNAQYRELHTTLHHHMVETARTTALNRNSSPDRMVSSHVPSASPTAPFIARGTNAALAKEPSLRCELVSQQRQLELWRNYLDEIAPWLDMLDRDRHFQITLPIMARRAPVLHYSILALSAREIERRSSERSYTESLGLYQQAIRMVAHRLQNLETEVIASCVLLCVLEMMSSSPRAWSRHLDGCAMLLEAAGINGAVGGVRQAIFWCFARMDLWGGYLGDTITKIPTNRWFIPSGSMAVAVNQFKDGSRADSYANYAVFLCASVVNVISAREVSQGGQPRRYSDAEELHSTRWKALYDLLEDWYNDRPDELLPLMNENPSASNYSNPFPIVLYATSPGVTGTQMYHAAAMLMLQHKPKDVKPPKSKKSILWHARQICGIAASNANHGAWINALQPLWMAGKVMSHPSEHQAILDILYRIESETGFATEWRANDLKEFWGDASE